VLLLYKHSTHLNSRSALFQCVGYIAIGSFVIFFLEVPRHSANWHANCLSHVRERFIVERCDSKRRRSSAWWCTTSYDLPSV